MASPYPHDMLDRAGDGGSQDCRAVKRYSLPLSGRWIAGGRWIHVMVETISCRGASLSGLAPLRSGDTGTLVLDDCDIRIPCDVRWVRDGLAGTAFSLSEADSTRLCDHIERLAGRGRIQLPPLVQPVPGR